MGKRPFVSFRKVGRRETDEMITIGNEIVVGMLFGKAIGDNEFLEFRKVTRGERGKNHGEPLRTFESIGDVRAVFRAVSGMDIRPFNHRNQVNFFWNKRSRQVVSKDDRVGLNLL
jgi:hypothetical protein